MRALRGTAPIALSLLAGLVQAASIASPWNGLPQWWLQIAALAVLAALLQREPAPRRAAALGWAFATAWLTGTYWWLFISLHTYGGLPAVMAAAAVVLLAAFLGLYYAFACFAHAKLARAASPWTGLLFASLWLGAELLRDTLFTGFPWGAVGYAHVDGPLSFLARWVGVNGIAWFAALLAFELALSLAIWRGASLKSAGVLAITLGLVAAVNLAGPQHVPGNGKMLTVTLLQGNIPQDEKFHERTGVPFALDWYKKQLTGASTELVVAPETAIPLLPLQLPDGYLKDLGTHFGAGARAALIGIPLGSYTDGYTNSVMGLKPASPVYRYDKHHLVPFGEFIPPLFKWFTRMMNIPLGDFNRGAVGQPAFDWQGQRLAPNICYEDLFGEELGARFDDPAKAPSVFVNLSNIGWFGDSIAIDQHLQISRMRAIEFERPMLRATNTGATVIIDRQGRVTHALQRHTRGALVGEVEGGAGITPFAWWVSRFWLWPLWALALAVPAAAWMRRRRLLAHADQLSGA